MCVTANCKTDLAEHNYACRAPVYAKLTARAFVFVDNKYNVVLRIITWLFYAVGFENRVGREHVDAPPRAYVHAPFAHNAFLLVDVEELLGTHRLLQGTGIYQFDLVIAEGIGHSGDDSAGHGLA